METKQVATVGEAKDILKHAVGGDLVIGSENSVGVDVCVGRPVRMGHHRLKDVGDICVRAGCLPS